MTQDYLDLASKILTEANEASSKVYDELHEDDVYNTGTDNTASDKAHFAKLQSLARSLAERDTKLLERWANRFAEYHDQIPRLIAGEMRGEISAIRKDNGLEGGKDA